MSARWVARAALGVVTLVAAGCVGTMPSTSSMAPNGPTASTPAVVGSVVTASPTRSLTPVGGGPPAAWLGVDGGDPVEGALGSYTWGDGGSDSPWLRGAPIDVGAGESLLVTTRPDVPVETWTARYAPVTATDPSGARALGLGRGVPTFEPPPTGTWTIEVRIAFADDAGDATYAWAVTVR